MTSARGAHDAPVRRLADLGAGQQATAGEAIAQQRQRVPAQREADRTVVGDDVLAFGGCRQLGRRFVEAAAGEERRQSLDAGHLPHRPMPMTGECRERAGIGEAGEIAAIERGALREIGDVGERVFTTRGDDSLRGALGQAADHPQAEPQIGVRAAFPFVDGRRA